jgi:hypothetical protein
MKFNKVCLLQPETLKIVISGQITVYHFLPAANFWARRMFCRLFHQHAAKTTRKRIAKSTPKAMPILAATDR